LKKCLFVSDLHGNISKYNKLYQLIINDQPEFVFVGGDILPHGASMFTSMNLKHKDFINDFLAPSFSKLKDTLKDKYPHIYILLGNDDARIEEAAMLEVSSRGIWHYHNFRSVQQDDYTIFGYCFVPPTPFQLKDWEKYDVSRYIDPGCISPEDGRRSIPISDSEKRYSTIKKDLELLTEGNDLQKGIFLFHSPPYQTNLDRAALDGKMIDYVPLDVNIGSIAIKRFIEDKQPHITMHGHVHESTRLTGKWKERIGRTYSFNAAHDGKELSVIKFDLDHPENAERFLL